MSSKDHEKMKDKIFQNIQMFSEKIVDIENQLSSVDLMNEYGNEFFIDYSHLCLITTQKYLKDAHLQLLKLQRNLSKALIFTENDNEVEEHNNNKKTTNSNHISKSNSNSTSSEEDAIHEIEHWKLSVHKLLDQIRSERNSFNKYQIKVEKEKKQLQKDYLGSKETISHLHGQLQHEKEQILELQKQLSHKRTEGDKRSNHQHQHHHHHHSPIENNLSTLSPLQRRKIALQNQINSLSNHHPGTAAPPTTSTSTTSTTTNMIPTILVNSPSPNKHFPPFHQMSSLSESTSSGSENKQEDYLTLHSKKLSPNELLFIYHRDVASTRAEISVLSQELVASGRREEELIEINLQLKQKIALLQEFNQSQSPHSPQPNQQRNSRRSFSSSTASRSFSLSPNPQSPYYQTSSHPLSTKLTEFYSSEITHLLNELESKHQEEVKTMIGKLHEKLNNLYEENNSLRQKMSQLKQENHQLMKMNHQLNYEKTTLERSNERMMSTTEHYKNLYNQLTSSSSSGDPGKQLTSSSSSTLITGVGGEDGVALEQEEDEEENENEDEEALGPSHSSKPSLGIDYNEILNEKSQLNDKILTLHNEKQSLLNEMYELKKRNNDLLFQLKQNKTNESRHSTGGLGGGDDIRVGSFVSTGSLLTRPSMRKSMSLL